MDILRYGSENLVKILVNDFAVVVPLSQGIRQSGKGLRPMPPALACR